MKVRILQHSTTFVQVYTRAKKELLGSSLAFTLKEGPVRCAKVCNKSWVIQYTLDLRKPDLRKNLDLRKIVGTTDFLVHKLFDLRKIF